MNVRSQKTSGVSTGERVVARRREAGVTLVELTIAATILAGGILMVVAVLMQSMNGGRSGLHLSDATIIAQSQIEQLQRERWTNILATGWTAPTTIANEVQGAVAKTEQTYQLSWRITDLDPGRTRSLDVRVQWSEPNKPSRTVTLSSIRDNYEAL